MLRGAKSIHFIGIGGVGMSGLAKVLLRMGYQISGSDVELNPLTGSLEASGARIYQGHHPSHLGRASLVVSSSAIPSYNPELIEAKKKKIPVVTRGNLLAHLTNRNESIVVAGTHGKTTTTSLICCILDADKKDPTMFIGGELNDIEGNSKLGKGEWVVAESDESDGSFLLIHPKIAVLTNLEDDHLDYYGSTDRINEAFLQFSQQLKPGGTLIVNKDDTNLRDLLGKIRLSYSQKIITFGVESQADLVARRITLEGFSCLYSPVYRGRLLGKVRIPLPGEYNVHNSLGAIAAALALDIPWETIKKAIRSFGGIKRRFECIGKTPSNILVVNDYAHHPTEIKATLKAARRLRRRIVVVFQPHRYSRTKILLFKFAHAFSEADILLLTPIYPAGEAPIPGTDGKLLFERVKEIRGKDTYYFSSEEKILSFLEDKSGEEDLIITLGAGDIGRIGREFLKRFLISS
ncbi:UDP-N-acetylmuramate--L-alanine ligase [Candidatus Aerophobetes bacterium]|uniref:UDP-N-acetylmuramate--L-alanine ligase n=1 Tax=Aerophobetes bacterium TaxID=2030807 RepID=A0A523W9V3_UNCAE|nr:MAG: UDP-N-acetylmuramate--L-alanine ligase [Candidatus Aerophobetes bacterium]